MALRRVGPYKGSKLKRIWNAVMYYDRKRRKDLTYQEYLNTPLDALVDPTFDTACAVNWTCGTVWTIGAGIASADGTSVAASDLTSATSLELGKSYRIVYEISNYVAGDIRPEFGTEIGTYRSANGTFEDTLTCSDSTDLTFSAVLNFQGSIDNIVIYPAD